MTWGRKNLRTEWLKKILLFPVKLSFFQWKYISFPVSCPPNLNIHIAANGGSQHLSANGVRSWWQTLRHERSPSNVVPESRHVLGCSIWHLHKLQTLAIWFIWAQAWLGVLSGLQDRRKRWEDPWSAVCSVGRNLLTKETLSVFAGTAVWGALKHDLGKADEQFPLKWSKPVVNIQGKPCISRCVRYASFPWLPTWIVFPNCIADSHSSCYM